MTKRKPKKPAITYHDNKTFSVDAVLSLDLNKSAVMQAILNVRGLPGGLPPAEYPSAASCEAVSPGVTAAQQRVRQLAKIPCVITLDANGDYTIFIPKS